MNDSKITLITDSTIVKAGGELAEGTVVIKHGKISEITTQAPGQYLLQHDNVEVISGKGCFLTPGLIEAHFNGGLGCNFNDAKITEIQTLFNQLPRFGITGALLTAISAPLEDMIKTTHTLEEAVMYQKKDATRMLGIHLEGPFINTEKRGSHPKNGVLEGSLEFLEFLLSPNVKMITMAPEIDPDGTLINAIKEKDILISIGHSNANAKEAGKAIQNGARSITHLFNAMRGFHHRDPGIIGHAFNNDEIFVQVIGDGDHVHPEGIHMIVNAKKDSDKLVLVSDSYPMAGMSEGANASFGHQQVTINNGRATNEEGRLVGGHVLLHECVRNLVRWDILPFPKAVQLATYNPAKMLGVDDTMGQIKEGYSGDLVLWDKNTLEVDSTMINGEQVYSRRSNQGSQSQSTVNA